MFFFRYILIIRWYSLFIKNNVTLVVVLGVSLYANSASRRKFD